MRTGILFIKIYISKSIKYKTYQTDTYTTYFEIFMNEHFNSSISILDNVFFYLYN